ncbi:N-acetyltransferase ESCO2-like isoform X2 [Dysidea avara]|uniref:N-acetyltransferase ESCO2-like isoform X2 n=1 Tax=Dysidea avara TaxID=196820 RepID=UPI00332B1E30
MTRSTNWGTINSSIKPVRKTYSHKKLKRLKHDMSKQLYLDFGQKSFGPMKCKSCGMLYTKGELEDEELHKKFHNKLIDGVQFSGWKNERVVGWFDEGRVVMVTPSDSKQHLKKVDEVLGLVHYDLGIEQDVKYGDLSKIFLFISSHKKVIGCVVADHIDKAYRAMTDPSSGLTCCRAIHICQGWHQKVVGIKELQTEGNSHQVIGLCQVKLCIWNCYCKKSDCILRPDC